MIRVISATKMSLLGLFLLSTPILVEAKHYNKHNSTKITAPASFSTKSEIKCLADNIYFEARGEGLIGWKAVGHVTMNRLRSKRFPSTVCGVVYQRGQFVWVGTRKAPSGEIYNRIRVLAENIYYNYKPEHDVTNGSINFRRIKSSSNSKKRGTCIGNHVFFT